VEDTVAFHKYTIMEHLGLKASAELVQYAPRAGNVEKAQPVFTRVLLVLTVSAISETLINGAVIAASSRLPCASMKRD
jgi:hypothetical protein